MTTASRDHFGFTRTTVRVRRNHGKWISCVWRSQRVISRLTAMLMALVGAFPVYALPPNALPTGGSVASGSASIGTTGNTMNIAQSSANAIINWGTFNIGSAATVNFRQPGETSIALNRVSVGGGASEIAGHLNANGQVFLVNPNGILFSKTAQVDVGGLVASSLDISNSNFNGSGNKVFNRGARAGNVTNLGHIRAADGGYVALIAPTVSNEGTIVATLGTVAMAGGDKVTLSFDEERLINLAVNKSTLDTLIDNKNIIRADGGMILMTAGAATSLTSSAVNNEGLLQAQRISGQDGVVRLEAAGADSSVSLAGEVKAQYGNVFATANTVAVTGDTRVNAANLTLNAKGGVDIGAALDLGNTETNLGLVAGSDGINGSSGLVRMGNGTLSLYTTGSAILTTENLGKVAGYAGASDSAVIITNTGGDVSISSGTILLDPNHPGTRYEITGFDSARYLRRNVLRDQETNQGSLALFNYGTGSVTVAENVVSAGDVMILAEAGPVVVNKPINAGNFLMLGSGSDISVDARLDAASILLDAADTARFSAQAQLFSHGTTSQQASPNDALVVTTRVFDNERGADLFSTEPGTRWLVYSEDPAANTKGGLLADFKRYDCAYGSCTTIPLTGNGFLYTITPTLIITPDGMHATYGDVHSLDAAHGYTASGFIDGDSLADLTGSANLEFSTPLTYRTPVGRYDVRYASGLASDLGYRIVDNTLSTHEYTIDPRVLNISAVAANKVYDGTPVVAATLGDDRIAGDVLSSSFSSASFSDKNAGSGKTVTVSGIGVSGIDAANYVVATNTANPAVATTSADIAPAILRIIGDSNVNKFFDNTVALPASAGRGFTISGLVGADTLSITAGASYDNAQPGARLVVIRDAAASGADAGNYALAVSNGTGTILPPDLTSAKPPPGSLIAPPPLALADFVNSLPPTAAGPNSQDKGECRGSETISPQITVVGCGVKREDQ